jgi:hypothetical protein
MKEKIIDKLVTPISTAFGLVIGLAWNGAVKNLFDSYYAPGQGALALFSYAIVVTIIGVLAILSLEHTGEKLKEIKISVKPKGYVATVEEKKE